MFAKLAQQDLASLRAAGFFPTDAQIIRLNDLAVRVERGKDTTVANMPRVGFAGNVILHEPTVGALEWWHNFGRDAAWTTRGKLDVYYWMLAHATDRDAFDVVDAKAIRQNVRAWRSGVFATDGELWRALLWVKTGENGDDEVPRPKAVESSVDEDAAMDRLFAAVIAAAGALSLRPDDLKTVTTDTLTALLIAANLHAKNPMKMSVAKDYIAYKLCLKEIESNGRRQ